MAGRMEMGERDARAPDQDRSWSQPVSRERQQWRKKARFSEWVSTMPMWVSASRWHQAASRIKKSSIERNRVTLLHPDSMQQSSWLMKHGHAMERFTCQRWCTRAKSCPSAHHNGCQSRERQCQHSCPAWISIRIQSGFVIGIILYIAAAMVFGWSIRMMVSFERKGRWLKGSDHLQNSIAHRAFIDVPGYQDVLRAHKGKRGSFHYRKYHNAQGESRRVRSWERRISARDRFKLGNSAGINNIFFESDSNYVLCLAFICYDLGEGVACYFLFTI